MITRADWLSGSAVRPIALPKLAPHECEQMVAAVAGSDFVPRRIIRQIVERTDGVPLFVEEFTRAMSISGTVRSPRRIWPERKVARTVGAVKYSGFTDGAP